MNQKEWKLAMPLQSYLLIFIPMNDCEHKRSVATLIFVTKAWPPSDWRNHSGSKSALFGAISQADIFIIVLIKATWIT